MCKSLSTYGTPVSFSRPDCQIVRRHPKTSPSKRSPKGGRGVVSSLRYGNSGEDDPVHGLEKWVSTQPSPTGCTPRCTPMDAVRRLDGSRFRLSLSLRYSRSRGETRGEFTTKHQ